MDIILASLIVCCKSVFLNIVARLAILSFSDSIFRGKFEQVSVTLSVKGHALDMSISSNYRPVSVLNFFSIICISIFALLSGLYFGISKF